MPNSARSGAIRACRSHGIRQIGIERDWCAVGPDVFIARAIARTGTAVEAAARDMLAGHSLSQIARYGLSNRDVVSQTGLWISGKGRAVGFGASAGKGAGRPDQNVRRIQNRHRRANPRTDQ